MGISLRCRISKSAIVEYLDILLVRTGSSKSLLGDINSVLKGKCVQMV
jgi:hypothetical protein